MISKRATAIASVLALALAAAPISSAFASDRHHGGYGHGGGYRGGHGGGCGYGYGFNPVVGLATALVGAAAAIVTAPIAIVAAVANAPYYGPGPNYPVGPAAYDAPPGGPRLLRRSGRPRAITALRPPPGLLRPAGGNLLQSACRNLLRTARRSVLRHTAGPRLLRFSRSWLLSPPRRKLRALQRQSAPHRRLDPGVLRQSAVNTASDDAFASRPSAPRPRGTATSAGIPVSRRGGRPSRAEARATERTDSRRRNGVVLHGRLRRHHDRGRGRDGRAFPSGRFITASMTNRRSSAPWSTARSPVCARLPMCRCSMGPASRKSCSDWRG